MHLDLDEASGPEIVRAVVDHDFARHGPCPPIERLPTARDGCEDATLGTLALPHLDGITDLGKEREVLTQEDQHAHPIQVGHVCDRNRALRRSGCSRQERSWVDVTRGHDPTEGRSKNLVTFERRRARQLGFGDQSRRP